jgi:hypothetical protein
MRCTRTLHTNVLALVASSLGNQKIGGVAYETTFNVTPVYTIPAGTLSMVDVIGRWMGASEMMHLCLFGCFRV